MRVLHSTFQVLSKSCWIWTQDLPQNECLDKGIKACLVLVSCPPETSAGELDNEVRGVPAKCGEMFKLVFKHNQAWPKKDEKELAKIFTHIWRLLEINVFHNFKIFLQYWSVFILFGDWLRRYCCFGCCYVYTYFGCITAFLVDGFLW